jgi:hypothetical protein
MKRNQRNASKRIVRSSRSVPTFAYAEVESALAEVFDARDAQPTTFRARLQNFRKLGIPAANPGKGQRLRYSVGDLFQLLLALELTEFGLDPALVVNTIRNDWARQGNLFAAVQHTIQQPPPTEDIFVVMGMNVLSASLGRPGIMETDEGLSLRSEPNAVTVKYGLDIDFTRLLREPRARLSIFNLSNRIRAVRKALAF